MMDVLENFFENNPILSERVIKHFITGDSIHIASVVWGEYEFGVLRPEDADIWVHEFVEAVLLDLLEREGISYRLTSYAGGNAPLLCINIGDLVVWSDVPHIIAAMTCISVIPEDSGGFEFLSCDDFLDKLFPES